MDPSIALSTFSLIFLAEIGDKSQLLAMTLAHRYRAITVIGGVFAAFLLLNLFAVFAGQELARLIPREWVVLTASGLFLFFGYQSWRDAENAGTAAPERRYGRNGLVVSFALVFVAEFGDKTQLAMATLSAGTQDIWSVFLGGTLALWSVSLLGILFGSTVLRKIPHHLVHRVAALLFVAFAVVTLLYLVRTW